MAIKIAGTTVLDDSRQLTNISGIDATSVTALRSAGLGTSVALDGNAITYTGQSEIYTITNYDINSTYTVAVTTGAVNRNEETITFTAPQPSNAFVKVTLTVGQNGANSNYVINVRNNTIVTPSITFVGNSTSTSTSTLQFTGSAFDVRPALFGTHASTEWQLANSSDFAYLTASVTGTGANLTSYTFTGLSLSLGSQYYARARYNSQSPAANSEWSPTVGLITTAGYIRTPILSNTSSTVLITGDAFTIVGTAAGETHKDTDWYIYSDAPASTLATQLLANTAYKTSLNYNNVPGISSPNTYYVKARYRGNLLGDPSANSNVLTAIYLNTVTPAQVPGATVILSGRGAVYTSPGTFTLQSFMDPLSVLAVGGGGGGSQSPVIGGAGGGTGNSGTTTVTGFTPGTPVSVTVGSGGGAYNGPYGNFEPNGPQARENSYKGTTGQTSSFGAYLSATGGTGGSAMWEGGNGGSGMTGGGGSASVNSSVNPGFGGYDGSANGQARATGASNPGFYTAGGGGTGSQPMINTVTGYSPLFSVPISNRGTYSGGTPGASAPGSPGGAGVTISGISSPPAPQGSATPNYSPTYTLQGGLGFGAGGRGGNGDAGGGAGGSLFPGASGLGGFVAVKW